MIMERTTLAVYRYRRVDITKCDLVPWSYGTLGSSQVGGIIYLESHQVPRPGSHILLDPICRLTQSHTGSYLPSELHQRLKNFGIDKKVLALAADNNTLVGEQESLGRIKSSETRVRCFAHTLNLV